MPYLRPLRRRPPESLISPVPITEPFLLPNRRSPRSYSPITSTHPSQLPICYTIDLQIHAVNHNQYPKRVGLKALLAGVSKNKVMEEHADAVKIAKLESRTGIMARDSLNIGITRIQAITRRRQKMSVAATFSVKSGHGD